MHTPGPWVAAKNDNTVVCAGDDPVRPGKILFVLRHPWGTNDHLDVAEMEANGRLAAAAPELLDAIRAMIAYDSATDSLERFADIIKQADTAIVKAIGHTERAT